MTIAVDLTRKATKQTNKPNNSIDAILEEKHLWLDLAQSGSSVSIVLVFYIFLQIHSIFMANRGEKLITIAVSLLLDVSNSLCVDLRLTVHRFR